jgi:catechol 2,3-dioxygenase-like lactoylglutathione lyase family enzyme
MAIVQLLQVSLCVRDLALSTRFYRDLLGCREVAAESFAGAAPSAAPRHAPAAFR